MSDSNIRVPDSTMHRYPDELYDTRSSQDGDPEAWEAHPWAVAFDGEDGAEARRQRCDSTDSYDYDSEDDDFANLPAMVRVCRVPRVLCSDLMSCAALVGRRGDETARRRQTDGDVVHRHAPRGPQDAGQRRQEGR